MNRCFLGGEPWAVVSRSGVEIAVTLIDLPRGLEMMYTPYNLMDFEAENPLPNSLIRSKKTVDFIKELLRDKNAVIADNYGHKIYRCPECDQLYGRFFIHQDYNSGSYETEYKCSKCKTALELIGEDISDEDDWKTKRIRIEKYPCPKCGKKCLSEDSKANILWDCEGASENTFSTSGNQ